MRRAPYFAPRIGSASRLDEVVPVDVSSSVPACSVGRSKLLPWKITRLRRDRCETPSACFYTNCVAHRSNGPVVSGGCESKFMRRWDARNGEGNPWQGGQAAHRDRLQSVAE